MSKKRFIDLATHGGCSKKVGAGELELLLENLLTNGVQELDSKPRASWLDFGRFDFDGNTWVSNVDIVLPMVPSPSEFGEIVVAHVLSDIYTAAAKPLFALNVLGIATDVSADDEYVVDMLMAAKRKLSASEVALVGGHTLGGQSDLYYGLAVFGQASHGGLITNEGAKHGDVLVLTKPLGTSVASINWKLHPDTEGLFSDVISSMKELNDIPGELLLPFNATSCTDITGFGFLGHLHNLLKSSGVSAVVRSDGLPVFESIKAFVNKECTTTIWSKNFDYVKNAVDFKVGFSSLLENILFDAQVSGGLLVTLPPERVDGFIAALNERGRNGWVVGDICAAVPGTIEIR